MPLAAVGAAAGLIGRSVIGVSLPFVGSYRVPLTAGLVTAIFTFVMAIVAVFVLALIINALAPTFGGEKNSAQALKVDPPHRLCWNDGPNALQEGRRVGALGGTKTVWSREKE